MRARHVLTVVAVTAIAVLALSIRAGAADLDRQQKPLRLDVGGH